MTEADVFEVLENTDEIPSIGFVAAEVVRLVDDPDSSFKEIGHKIGEDPGLVAALLRLANSPLYGLRREISSPDHAVGLLGLAEVRNLVLTASVIKDFSAGFGRGRFNWKGFWEHSCGCALIAKTLTRTAKLDLGGAEYVAGLLHDVGKILLGHHFPGKFTLALDLSNQRCIPMHEAEAEVFGTDHEKVGGWLADKWAFPDGVKAAISCHHRIGKAGDNQLIAAIVRVANILTKNKMIGFGGDNIAVCLEDDPAWWLVTSVGFGLARTDIERFTFNLDAEVDGARTIFESRNIVGD